MAHGLCKDYKERKGYCELRNWQYMRADEISWWHIDMADLIFFFPPNPKFVPQSLNAIEISCRKE